MHYSILFRYVIISQYGMYISFNTVSCLKVYPKGEIGDNLHRQTHTWKSNFCFFYRNLQTFWKILFMVRSHTCFYYSQLSNYVHILQQVENTIWRKDLELLKQKQKIKQNHAIISCQLFNIHCFRFVRKDTFCPEYTAVLQLLEL